MCSKDSYETEQIPKLREIPHQARSSQLLHLFSQPREEYERLRQSLPWQDANDNQPSLRYPPPSNFQPLVLRTGERIKFDTTSKTEPNEPLTTTDRDGKDFASVAGNTQSSFNKSKENEYFIKSHASPVRPSTELRTRPGDTTVQFLSIFTHKTHSKDVLREKEVEIETLRGRVHVKKFLLIYRLGFTERNSFQDRSPKIIFRTRCQSPQLSRT